MIILLFVSLASIVCPLGLSSIQNPQQARHILGIHVGITHQRRILTANSFRPVDFATVCCDSYVAKGGNTRPWTIGFQYMLAHDRSGTAHIIQCHAIVALPPKTLPFALSLHEATANIAPPPVLGPLIVANNLMLNLPRRIDWTKPLRFIPKEVMAIYLPSWFVDVNASFHNRIAVSPDKPPTLQVGVPHAFFPGHTLDPLCRMSMRSIQERDLIPQAVPFTSNLRSQHGVDVTCIPYGLSPLSLVQAFIEFTKNKFRPSEYMIAAYPVLIPVYLAKYAIDLPVGTVETFAVVEAASKEGGAVYVRNVLHRLNELYGTTDVQFAVDLANNVPEFDVRPTSASNILEVYDCDHPQKLIEGLGPNFSSQLGDLRKLLTRYADFERAHREGGRLDFDDLRIREWTQEETENVQAHMSARSMLQSIVKMNYLLPGGVDKGKIEQFCAAVDETKPAWLRQWEEQHTPRGS